MEFLENTEKEQILGALWLKEYDGLLRDRTSDRGRETKDGKCQKKKSCGSQKKNRVYETARHLSSFRGSPQMCIKSTSKDINILSGMERGEYFSQVKVKSRSVKC